MASNIFAGVKEDLTSPATPSGNRFAGLGEELRTPTSNGTVTAVPGTDPGAGSGTRALRRGVATTKLLGGEFTQFLGGVLGIEAVEGLGEDIARSATIDAINNPSDVSSVDDIDSLATLGTFVVEKLGENLPMLATIAGSAGIGGVVGGAMTTQRAAGIGKALIQETAKQAAIKRGALTGAFGAGEVLGVGEVAAEIREQGFDPANNPFLTIGAGTAIAGLDIASLGAIYKTAFKGVAPEVADSFVRRVARGFGVGTVSEMPTEAAQELIAISANKFNDPSYEIFSPANLKRLRDAGIAGGVVGGALGGATGAAAYAGERFTDNLNRANASPAVTRGKQALMSILPSDPNSSAGQRNDDDPDGPDGPAPVVPGLFDFDLARQKLSETASNFKNKINTAMAAAASGMSVEEINTFNQALSAQGQVLRDELSEQLMATETFTREKLKAADMNISEMISALDDYTATLSEADPADAAPTNKQIIALKNRLKEAGTQARDEIVEAAQIAEDIVTGKRKVSKKRARQLVANMESMRAKVVGSIAKEIDQSARQLKKTIKGVDKDLAQLPQPSDQAPSTTLREPQKVVRAQLTELARGTKRAVLGTEGEAQELLQDFVAQTDELVLLNAPEGLVATRRENAESVQADIEAGRLDQALGFSGPKPDGDGVVVQARNDAGTVVSEEVTSADNLGNAIEAAPTADVQVKTAQDVLVERGEELIDEQSVFWAPIGATGGARGTTGINDDGTLSTPKARPYKTQEKAAEVAAQLEADAKSKGKTATYDTRPVQGGYVVRQVFSDPTERTIQRMSNTILRKGRNIKDPRYVMSVGNIRMSTRLITALGRELNGGTNNSDAFKALNAKGDFLSGLAQMSIELGIPLPAPRDNVVVAGDITWGQLNRISERLSALEGALRSPSTSDARKEAITSELKDQFGFTFTDNFDPAELETTEPFESAEKLRPLLEGDARVPFSTTKNESPRRPDQVVNLTNIDGAAAGVQSILESLGIKEKVMIIDEVSAPQVVARLRARIDDEVFGKDFRLLADIIEGQAKNTAQASINGGLFDVLSRLAAEDRYVPIFVRNKETYANRHQALAHELGHLVELTALYSAPKSVRDEVLASVGGKNREEQLENFATNVAMWANKAFKDGRIDPNLEGVERFFEGLGAKLADFWKRFKSIFGGQYSESFRDFMDALHMYNSNGYRSRPVTTKVGRDYMKWLRENGAQPYIYDNRADFLSAEGLAQLPTPEELSADSDGAFASYAERAKAFFKRLKAQPLNTAKEMGYTADAELRGMGAAWLADMFWARPGDRTGVPETVFEKIRRLAGPLHSDLSKLLDSMGDMSSETNKAVGKALVRQTPLDQITDNTVKLRVAGLRRYLDKVYEMYTGEGLRLRRRKNFSPLQLNPLVVEANKDEFISILRDEGYSEEAAQSFFDAVVHDKNGGLVETLDDTPDVDFAGPGTPFNKKRKLRRSTRKALEKFWQDDIALTMLTYTDFMARRAVWESKFNLAGHGVTTQQARAMGVGPKDPIAGLQYELKKRRRNGELTPQQYDRITNHILPAYAGRLGMDLNPKLRKVMGYTLVYQNIRLLAFSMFSQIVDAGTLMARAGPAGALGIGKAIREARTGDAKEMARALGIVRDGVTEHILNEQALNTYSNSRDKKLNDMLFKYNLMEGWTNAVRTTGMILGREFLLSNRDKALAGDAKAKSLLKELNIMPEDLVGWDGSNPQENSKIGAALHRFVDQAMLRPNPAVRPVWMSDPHYALFAHLKPFLYAYYETFVRRTVANMRIDRTIMPLILIGLFTLPFAMLGYELRRKLTGTKAPYMSSGEYLWEMTQRTGLFGPMQMVLDMEQSSNFNKPFVLGLAGPTVEQTYDFMTKDFDTFMSKAIPIANNFGPAREFVRDTL